MGQGWPTGRFSHLSGLAKVVCCGTPSAASVQGGVPTCDGTSTLKCLPSAYAFKWVGTAQGYSQSSICTSYGTSIVTQENEAARGAGMGHTLQDVGNEKGQVWPAICLLLKEAAANARVCRSLCRVDKKPPLWLTLRRKTGRREGSSASCVLLYFQMLDHVYEEPIRKTKKGNIASKHSAHCILLEESRGSHGPSFAPCTSPTQPSGPRRVSLLQATRSPRRPYPG